PHNPHLGVSRWPEGSTTPLPLCCPLLLQLGHALGDALVDQFGHQMTDVAVVGGHLLDKRAGQETVHRVVRHEHGFDAGELAVHLSHLQLVVEIADRAQPFHDRGDVVVATVVHHQAVPGVDADVRQCRGGVPQHLDPLVDREHPPFALIDQHGHGHLVEQPGGTLDDVEVTIGHRVVRTRAYCTAHE